MKTSPVTRIDEGWEIWRCTACNTMLCLVRPAPGMMLESECRKCGKKDIRMIPIEDIDTKYAQLRRLVIADVMEILDARAKE